tara:strand:+ start:39 stop:530 length:492 start_codon:yes stop_codon:yes gene_type:complete
MDWEPVVAISQILTGLATLIVAVFLAGQLKLQSKSLDRAHEDANRELTMSSVSLNLDYMLSRTTREEIRDSWAKRHLDLNELSSNEFDSLTTYLRSSYFVANSEWRLGRNVDYLLYYRQRFGYLMDFKAGHQFYNQSMRDFVLPGLRTISEEVYESHKEEFGF